MVGFEGTPEGSCAWGDRMVASEVDEEASQRQEEDHSDYCRMHTARLATLLPALSPNQAASGLGSPSPTLETPSQMPTPQKNLRCASLHGCDRPITISGVSN